jgi:enoyl-[acyl-carrier protein] reductase II
MIHTDLCNLLGIQSTIIQAAIAPYTSAELVTAVSNAGGLGSVGSALRSIDDLKNEIEKVKELTKHAFAINFTINSFDEDAVDLQWKKQNPKSFLRFSN